MVEIVMVKQLMNHLNNTMKSEKYQHDKVMITQLAGCLLDFAFFEKNYRLIGIDLSKQKSLDVDPKAIQQIIFTGQAPNNKIRIYYILEQSKERILEFAKGTTKVL